MNSDIENFLYVFILIFFLNKPNKLDINRVHGDSTLI